MWSQLLLLSICHCYFNFKVGVTVTLCKANCYFSEFATVTSFSKQVLLLLYVKSNVAFLNLLLILQYPLLLLYLFYCVVARINCYTNAWCHTNLSQLVSLLLCLGKVSREAQWQFISQTECLHKCFCVSVIISRGMAAMGMRCRNSPGIGRTCTGNLSAMGFSNCVTCLSFNDESTQMSLLSSTVGY